MGALELDPGKRSTLEEVAGALELARQELELDSELAREVSERKPTSEVMKKREPVAQVELQKPASPAAFRPRSSVGMLAAAVLVGVMLGVAVMALSPWASPLPAPDDTVAQAPAVSPTLIVSTPREIPLAVEAVNPRPVPPLLDLEAALDGIADALKGCATQARQGVTVELAAAAGDTRLGSIDVFPADAALGRCVRGLLEPLRFAAQPQETTIVRRYLP